MIKYFAAVFLSSSLFLFSCRVTQKNYSPLKKYDRSSLQQDYQLLRKILEKKHPSLYWYSSKDSMDRAFQKYYDAIADSMTEQQFAWHILAPLVNKIHCGHTSVSMSKGYSKWVENKKLPSFPLYMKIWNDTMVAMLNLDRKDSTIKRGTIITSVNGISTHNLIEQMFDYLPIDGYTNTINYIRLSANFPYYHRNVYGISKTYNLTYIDSGGAVKSVRIPAWLFQKDSARKKNIEKIGNPKTPKEKRITAYRSFKIDSSGRFAVMTLNTFAKGRLRKFFRNSFQELNEKNIKNLVLDIRLNGGGRVGSSTLLSRYISRQNFRVADSLFAVSKNLGPYTKYIRGRFLNNIELFFVAKKHRDNYYHLNYLERKVFKPKRNNHYNGKVYVLTAGPTFSASALFCNLIKGQAGITLMGEETGGGWYGNNGIMIPDIILPHTKVRVRLPLFRLVQYNHVAKKGTGIIPEVYIGTSYDALLKGYDKKMKVAEEMIKNSDLLQD